MGIDTHIRLPGNVRVHDVAKIIAILCGCPAALKPLTGTNSKYVDVDGIKVTPSTMPEACYICVDAKHFSPAASKVRDGESVRILFQFESKGMRYIGGGCGTFWQTIGRGLINFFGGVIDDNDSDESEVDYERPARSDVENCPEDGKAWDDFQTRMIKVKPITFEQFVSQSGDKLAGMRIMTESEFVMKYRPHMTPPEQQTAWANDSDRIYWILAYHKPPYLFEMSRDYVQICESAKSRSGSSYDKALSVLNAIGGGA